MVKLNGGVSILSAVADYLGWPSPHTYFGVTTLHGVRGDAAFHMNVKCDELRASCVVSCGMSISEDFKICTSDPDMFGKLEGWMGSFDGGGEGGGV